MLAAFKRCLLFENPYLNLKVKLVLSQMCWNCLYHSFIPGRRQKLKMGGVERSRNNFGRRHYCNTDYTASIIVGIPWAWPPLMILNNTFGKYQSVTTQASSSEDDEFLSQVLSKVERSPNLASEISSTQIEKLCCDNKISAALMLFQSLRDRHIFFEAKAYNLLLLAACKVNNIRLVSQIFKDFLISNKPISAATYINLAKAFKDIKDDDYLLGFISSVSNLTIPSATVINRIIYAFDVCGQTGKALVIYFHMKSLKCKPDLITYNSVLGILGRAGRGDEMLHEFSSMKEAEIIPDIVSYNTLINCFRKLGRLDLCSAFMEEVRDRGLELDLRTYTALIDCFGHSGNIEESLRLLNEMKSKRIKPSIYIYRSLINNAKKMGKTELALRFMEEMNASLYNLIGPKDFKKKKR